MITDEDEAFDSQLPMMFGHKEREEVGFKKLGGLVDDGQREVLERKEGRGSRQRGGSSDHNTHHLEELRDFCHVLLLRSSVFQQIRQVFLAASQGIADAQEVQPGSHKFAADFIDSAIGESPQQDLVFCGGKFFLQ